MTVMIQAKRLVYNEQHAELDFQAALSQLNLIIGPTDSGKTALMQTLAGIRYPSAGEIDVLDQNPHALNQKEWQSMRRHIAYVMPSRSLISHLSVLQNLSLPLIYHGICRAAQAKSLADEMLDYLELNDLADKLPGFLNERQRRALTIGRALIMQPPILFIDQGFAHLDAPARNYFSDLYLRILSERQLCLIIASKDMQACLQLAKAWQATPPSTSLVAKCTSKPRLQLLFMAQDRLHQFQNLEGLMQSPDPQINSYRLSHAAH